MKTKNLLAPLAAAALTAACGGGGDTAPADTRATAQSAPRKG